MKYFIYCRKSTESEERQALSIESQKAELVRAFGNRPDIDIVETFEESKSAKGPGRPIFSEVVRRIERGDAEGILAWHPDRLARNSIDGGQLIYLLDTGRLKDLKFVNYSFENTSQGKFVLQIMFGYSKYYVDALSENVKRGNRARAARGWRPSSVPIGYKHEPETKTIAVDQPHFRVVKRLFALALSGQYTVRQIQRIANDDWGYRTPKKRFIGGTPIALSTMYRMFANPFYAGLFFLDGKLYQGKHEAAISSMESDRIQAWLRRPGTQKPQRYRFAYVGMIRCGACGLMVTAEHKANKRYGTRYVYYHCTHRNRDRRCLQPVIEVKRLETQIAAFLPRLKLDDGIHRELLERARDEERAGIAVSEARAGLQQALSDVDRQRRNLEGMRIRDQIDDDVFTERNKELQLERKKIEARLARLDVEQSQFESIEAFVSFSKQATDWFLGAEDDEKRIILHAVGSNLELTDKKLNIEAAFPFSCMERMPAYLTMSPREESNLDPELRRLLFYPLNYGEYQNTITLPSA